MVARLCRIREEPNTDARRTTPASPAFNRRRFLIGFLAVVVLAEMAARVLGPLSPDNANLVGEFDRSIERLDARVEPVDTFIIGASEVAVAIDPEALANASSPVHNAHTVWMPGIGVGTVAALTQDVVLAHHHPERLIIGLTSREANAGDQARQVRDDALLSSLAYRSAAGDIGLLDRLQQRVGRFTALVREREGLRSPLKTAQHLIRNGTAPLPALEVNAYGMHTDRLGVASYAETPGHYAQEQAALANFELDYAGLAELESVLSSAIAADIDVVIVQVPVYERHYFTLQPGLAAQDLRFVQAMEALTRRSAATYLDPREALDWDDPSLWADVNHLNGNGAARLTSWLASQLDS